MRSLRLLLLVALPVAACSNPNEPSELGPPAGTTTWNVSYRTATVFTCPPITPDSGTATMTADPSGNVVTLVDQGTSLGGGVLATIIFTRDSTGLYSWTDPTGRATLTFKFVSATATEGEAKRLASPTDPCSATWPFLMARQ